MFGNIFLYMNTLFYTACAMHYSLLLLPLTLLFVTFQRSGLSTTRYIGATNYVTIFPDMSLQCLPRSSGNDKLFKIYIVLVLFSWTIDA